MISSKAERNLAVINNVLNAVKQPKQLAAPLVMSIGHVHVERIRRRRRRWGGGGGRNLNDDELQEAADKIHGELDEFA